MPVGWRIAAFVLLAGCSGAMRLDNPETPVMPGSLLPSRAGATICAYNNLPIVLVDSGLLASKDGEIVLVHEQVHAARMRAYRGGCWPFTQRYNRDRTFRALEELAAYCAEGRFAIRRNRDPELAWQRIVLALAKDTALTERDNCLYESPP